MKNHSVFRFLAGMFGMLILLGAAGSLELDKIGFLDAIVQGAAGLLILGFAGHVFDR